MTEKHRRILVRMLLRPMTAWHKDDLLVRPNCYELPLMVFYGGVPAPFKPNPDSAADVYRQYAKQGQIWMMWWRVEVDGPFKELAEQVVPRD